MIRSVAHVISYEFSQAEIVDLIRQRTDAILPERGGGEEDRMEVSGIATTVTISVTYPDK